MKTRQTIRLLVAALIIAVCLAVAPGCAQFQNVQQTLGQPPQVQADITILGALAKSHINADAQVKIHWFATQLNSAASLDLDVLFALLPHTGSQNGDALIAAAKAYLTIVVQKWGTHNQMSIDYAHAVANGLLANF